MIDEMHVTDYCPELNKQYTVTVRYDGKVRVLGECDHAGIYGCSQHSCPIFEKFPENRF